MVFKRISKHGSMISQLWNKNQAVSKSLIAIKILSK
jgi:hypothetical protein